MFCIHGPAPFDCPPDLWFVHFPWPCACGRLYEQQVGAEAAEAEERACDVERYRDLETAMQEEEDGMS